MAQSWDGWVLYTASNGHKYHYNHLTHESRWALDQRAEDHKAEEHFQQYLRQRASVIDPDEQDRSDRLDAAEAGDEEEDSDVGNTDVPHSSAFVSPYAGVGPMTMPAAGDREPPRTAGFAGRVSGALRMAMAKVERSRRGGEVDNSGVVTSEWDPELGQTYSKRREREGWEQGLPAGGGSRSSSCSESGSSSESSSSESGSSESSRSSSSDSDSDSAAHTVNGHALPRSGAPSTTRRQSTRSRNGEAERPPRVPKGDRRTGRRHVVNLRSSSSRRRLESLRHPRERRRSRAQTSSRRHYSRRRKVDAKRRSEAYSSTENSRVSQTATGHGLADLGRQAVASVVNIAFRAVLGSWNGVTTAAFKAIRTWQVNADMRSSGLPMVVTNSSHKESSGAPRTCQLEDEWWGGEQRQGNRAPYRSFMPKMEAPPPSSQQQQQQRAFHGGGRFTGGVEGRTLARSERTRVQGIESTAPGGRVLEGFREGEDDPTSSPAGSWGEGEGEGGYSGVMLEGGTEERKGGLTSPPPSWRKVSV